MVPVKVHPNMMILLLKLKDAKKLSECLQLNFHK